MRKVEELVRSKPPQGPQFFLFLVRLEGITTKMFIRESLSIRTFFSQNMHANPRNEILLHAM